MVHNLQVQVMSGRGGRNFELKQSNPKIPTNLNLFAYKNIKISRHV